MGAGRPVIDEGFLVDLDSGRTMFATGNSSADLLGDVRRRIEEASKLRNTQCQNFHLVHGSYRGIARSSFDECHFSKKVAAAQYGHFGTIHRASGVTVLNEKELSSKFALGRKGSSFADIQQSAQSGDCSQFRLAASREQRHCRKHVQNWLRNSVQHDSPRRRLFGKYHW